MNIRAILADPTQRRRLMVSTIIATQAREGITTTYEQAAAAYDVVRTEAPHTSLVGTMTKLYKHGDLDDNRDNRTGRYVKTPPCDACGKPTNEAERYTDDAVCQGSDRPGFFLCHRKRCPHNQDGWYEQSVEVRRALYNAQREKNDARKKQ